MKQVRWRSPIAWSALAGLIFFMMKSWLNIEIPEWDEFITLLISVLTAFGIFNNPENKDSF
jgi:uncharacterized membrane protein